MNKMLNHLKKLRELCDRATDGPWYIEENEVRHDFDPYATEEIGADCTTRIAACWDFQQNELKFIAQSRTAMPQLIRALEVAVEALTFDSENNGWMPSDSKLAVRQIEQILKGGESDFL